MQARSRRERFVGCLARPALGFCNKDTPTLLVLDGLVPMQHPSGPLLGQLEDRALAGLLEDLLLGRQGLCAVTTSRAAAARDLAEATRLARHGAPCPHLTAAALEAALAARR
ncbi:MAG: hypothetical protein ABIO70_31580 [Pseudomonadota bacterium]